MEIQYLIDKYNVPAPRYTSYPTVPFWKEDLPSNEEWLNIVKIRFDETNDTEGISLYIHLPYCESLCTYCGCNTRITVNHGVEAPYIETVLREWSIYKETFIGVPQIKDLHLGGGTPTFFSPDNLEKLINGILFGCTIHPEAEFSFEGHPANTTIAHLQKLYDLKFRRVSFGIQDFDSVVQDTINRYQSFEQVSGVTVLAREIGYHSVNFDLIYGLPKQSYRSIQDTVAKVLALKPDRIAYYSYAHVPWMKPGQRKFTELDLPDGKEKRRLYEIGRQMLLDEGYVDIGMDHFTLPGEALQVAQLEERMHRNFMGYTDKKSSLLIGLGVSAISDAGKSYIQNCKTIENYRETIGFNKLAIHKGIVLSDNDIRVKKMILDILCNLKSIIDFAVFDSEEIRGFRERLDDMVSDGLIELDGDNLIVTELGKNFVRNICMSFDRYLNKTSELKFSKAI